MKSEFVAEIEGEYGPLTISEHLVQKIWARGDFLKFGIKTLEGSALEILNLGQWNLLAGPDFKGVSIKVDGQIIHGDAELHFFDSDWGSHGHESDTEFRNVILHILVFPPKKRNRPIQCSVPHSLLFLELLPQGLESYAEEEALGSLTIGDESDLEIELMSLPLEERMSVLEEGARKRWQGKLGYARSRIQTLGWEEACHQTALEILGYRYNRTTMLFIGGDYSLEALRSGKFSASELFEAGKPRWRVSGTRPANHPKQRLRQYNEWVSLKPFWPVDLEKFKINAPRYEGSNWAALSRKELGLRMLKNKISEEVMADTIGGSRIENLVCDGFLPLLSAHKAKDLFPFWYHWYPGDIPESLRKLIRRLWHNGSRTSPICNGGFQGLLQRSLEDKASLQGK